MARWRKTRVGVLIRQEAGLGGVHEDGGHVARVLLVPAQAQQRAAGLAALVDDGGVLFVPATHRPARPVIGSYCDPCPAITCSLLAPDVAPSVVQSGQGVLRIQ